METMTATRRRQRGASLFEALVAFVVLAFGALAVAPLQSQLRLHGDAARQRTEAVRLGEQELETVRAFSAIAAASGVAAYEAIVDAERTVDGTTGWSSNTAYRIVRRIDDAAFGSAKSASVAVEWADRTGTAQRIGLQRLRVQVVESYPHDLTDQTKKMSSSFLYNGTRRLYERLGFTYDRPKGLKNCVMVKTVEPA